MFFLKKILGWHVAGLLWKERADLTPFRTASVEATALRAGARGQSLALLLFGACSCPGTPGSCVLRLHANQSSSCRHQTPQIIAGVAGTPRRARGGSRGAQLLPEHLSVCLHRWEEAGVTESSLVLGAVFRFCFYCFGSPFSQPCLPPSLPQTCTITIQRLLQTCI